MKISESPLSNLTQRHIRPEITDKSIMEIGASFWEDERYDAFKTLYQSFRFIDDQIDDLKARKQGISKTEKQQLTVLVNHWVNTLTNPNSKNRVENQVSKIIRKFQVPLWTVQRFAKAMIYDIHHDGFKDFSTFLEYAEGAAVAPATIYIHLCSVTKEKTHYHAPCFDGLQIARPAAIFCYLVHIIRDFEKDQKNNMNYFAKSWVLENELKSSTLKEIATGAPIDQRFRNLMKQYCRIAEDYRLETQRELTKIGKYLEAQHYLSLKIVFDLYVLFFRHINSEKGRFTTRDRSLSHRELSSQIEETIKVFELNSE